MRIVSFFGFPGISTNGLRIKCDSIPEIKRDEKGLVGIEDIIYKALRCSLIHECTPDSRIIFLDQTKIGDSKEGFTLPSKIILGLIVFVILSEENSLEKSKINLDISLNDVICPIDDLWGKKQKIFPKLTYGKTRQKK